jgi:hypothetical protein
LVQGLRVWGLNIHTSGEERDHIADAISAYALEASPAVHPVPSAKAVLS